MRALRPAPGPQPYAVRSRPARRGYGATAPRPAPTLAFAFRGQVARTARTARTAPTARTAWTAWGGWVPLAPAAALGWMGALLATVALAFLAGPASAQVPSIPPVPVPTSPPPADFSGRLEVTLDDAAPIQVSVDQSSERGFTVRYIAARDEVPQDPRFARNVFVTARAEGVGWSADATPASLTLAPGQSAKGTVLVAVGPQAGEGSKVRLEAFSPSRTGLDADPALSAAAETSAQRADTLTRQVLENVGPMVYALLALIPLLLLVLIVAFVRRPSAGVTLSAPTTSGTLAPGARLSFPIAVGNPSRRPQAVRLEVSEPSEGWVALLPEPEVVVAARSQHATEVVVVAPASANPAPRQALVVRAYPVNDAKRVATVLLEAALQGSDSAPQLRKPRPGSRASAAASP